MSEIITVRVHTKGLKTKLQKEAKKFNTFNDYVEYLFISREVGKTANAKIAAYILKLAK